MPKQTITQALAQGAVLVSDGAWGTMLQNAGLTPGDCPELWNATHPDAVREIARRYVEAGSNMVETNSFGGNRFRLDHFGLGSRTSELNEAAARISRDAAGETHWVLGSVGPTGKMLVMGEVSERELYDAFAEQVCALERGGADAICVETMADIDEARAAVRAAKEQTRLEVVATFTFERTVQGTYRSMMGVSPVDAARAMLDAGADIVGTNCGNGFERMIPIVGEIAGALPGVPLLVHANAGLPVSDGDTQRYPDTPEFMASLVADLTAAGACIIGGCCGTTPEHIAAIREAVRGLGPR